LISPHDAHSSGSAVPLSYLTIDDIEVDKEEKCHCEKEEIKIANRHFHNPSVAN
jgi:hypothetical protein